MRTPPSTPGIGTWLLRVLLFGVLLFVIRAITKR